MTRESGPLASSDASRALTGAGRLFPQIGSRARFRSRHRFLEVALAPA
jgi:hypothetical protein